MKREKVNEAQGARFHNDQFRAFQYCHAFTLAMGNGYTLSIYGVGQTEGLEHKQSPVKLLRIHKNTVDSDYRIYAHTSPTTITGDSAINVITK